MDLREQVKRIIDKLSEEKLKELFHLLINWIR